MQRISIITVVRNASRTISRCVESILSQSAREQVEYIVVDGKSTDGTWQYLSNRKENIDVLISEEDDGLYDAINKGIALSSGELIGVLHADDYYINNYVLERVVERHESRQVDGYSYDLNYVDKNGKIIRRWHTGPYTEGAFEKGWVPAHPSFFVRRECYNKYGYYDTNFKIASDYDMLFRLIKVKKISFEYIPEVILNMEIGGLSNRKLSNIFRGNAEIKNVWKKYGFRMPIFQYFTNKMTIRLLQLLKRRNYSSCVF